MDGQKTRRLGVRFFVAVLMATVPTAATAQAPLFGLTGIEYTWQADLLGRLVSTPDGVVLCETPWSIMLEGQDDLILDESLTSFNGGCDMVTLSRSVRFSASVAPDQAILRATTSIGAGTSESTDRAGRAQGTTSSLVVSSFEVLQWTHGDLAISCIADLLRQNATTHMSCQFRGPIDPSTGVGVLYNFVWDGTDRSTTNLPNASIPPGIYQLHAEAFAAFNDIARRTYAANLAATVNLTSAVAADPWPELDLDGDGSVGLDDACLWPKSPTDADLDGQIDQADLELILALARARGEEASDANGDGQPDQCGCQADWNHDGRLDFFDVQTFLGDFALYDPSADLNEDGIHNFFDIQEFLGLFASGC